MIKLVFIIKKKIYYNKNKFKEFGKIIYSLVYQKHVFL